MARDQVICARATKGVSINRVHTSSDLVLALRLADLAERVSSRRFGTSLEVGHKPDGSLVTDVDREIQNLLVGELRRQRPDEPISGREGDRGFDTSGRCWFIDPIDGTEHFRASS